MKYVKTFFCYLSLSAFFGSTLLMVEAAPVGGKAWAKGADAKGTKASKKKSEHSKSDQEKAAKAAKPDSPDGGAPKAPVPSKKSKLSPETQQSVKQANLGFKDCQSEALTAMKSGKISPKEFKIQMTACRERYPGAGIYVACKKKALKQFSRNTDGAKSAISQCKKFLIAASFDPSESFPFFVHEEKVYFAGIGMNKSQSIADFSLPNFDCTKLKEQAENPEHAEHILFGNHPVWFAKLRGKKEEAILRLLKASLPIPEEGLAVENFGRVFGDPTKNDSSVFFPSSSCVFSGELGTYFSGLTSYFLIDKESKAVTPYFAIAFYKPQIGGKGATTAVLAERMLASLGDGYVTAAEDGQRTMLAVEKITKFDDDGDPKDLCKVPRKHKYLAIIKARAEGSTEPEFLLVANIPQLCDYGDRLSRRL
jgi:hypothetical protein